MDVQLKKVERSNFHDVIELELEAHQEKYLPSNLYSIAESVLSPLFHPRVICLDNKTVGFAMYQFGEIGESDEDECTVWRFMIDKKHQNSGVGTLAMGLLLKDIKTHDCCSLIDIYYDPNNKSAKRIYEKYGFIESGFRDDGDVIAELEL